MATPTCIYCGAAGGDVIFTREHVVQVAFGSFKNAPVLHNCVCHSCNQYFSGTLDLALARQSVEGLQRYQWGVKAPEEVQRFRSDAMDFRAGELGDYTGARLELTGGPDGVRVRPVAGAAMRNADDDQFTHFTVEQILSGEWRSQPVDWRRGVKLFGDDSTTASMRVALETQGVSPTHWRPLAPPEADGPITVEQTITITSEMRRGLAKVAFNYLAFIAGADFCLPAAFDPLRQYVRFDVVPQLNPVHSDDTLPFMSNAADDQRPVVHFLSLSTHEEHGNLLGGVMLFGMLNHTVVLAEAYAGPWIDLPVAHLFNVKQREAARMPRRSPK